MVQEYSNDVLLDRKIKKSTCLCIDAGFNRYISNNEARWPCLGATPTFSKPGL